MQDRSNIRDYTAYRLENPAEQGLANYLQIDLKRPVQWLRIKYRRIIAVAIVGVF